jgi:MoaA/NifB/PqqE/SkfB family radical SAM enzyme
MSSVYSNLKLLAYPDQLAALRAGQVSAPVHVRIKPINRCNHACSYCAYRSDELQLGADMIEADRLPEPKLFEICDDIITMGVAAVTFSGGGEPMLHKSLPDAVSRLGRGGVRIGCLTNGSNLRGRMADAFAQHGTWVRISLDAWDDASYAASRKIGEGAFSNLLRNMEQFSARQSGCVLGVSFIVTPDNADRIYDVCRCFKALGVQHVKLSGVITSNDGHASNEHHYETREIASAEIERAMGLSDTSFGVIDHYYELEERFEKNYTSCYFARFSTVIGANACVYACQDKAYTGLGLLGSVADRSFKEFWFSNEARATLALLDPSNFCQHHCVANKKNRLLQDFLDLDADHSAFV